MHPSRIWLLRILAPTLLLISTLMLPAGSATAATSRVIPATQPTGVVSGLDVARIPGVTMAVGRSFDSYETTRSSGIGHLEFAVLAFDDTSAAHAALPKVFPALNIVLRRDAQPVDPPVIGDEALAWNASGPQDFTIATLIVRDDDHIHLFIGVAQSGDPIDAVNAIAGRTVGRQTEATPVATPAPDAQPLQAGELWDLLPRYDDLPGSFGLYTEESWPPDEILGVPPAANPADCDVEPRPASDFKQGAPSASPVASPLATEPVITIIPEGEPADAATMDAVTTVTYTHISCIALGDWLRAYNLVSDHYLSDQLEQLPPEIIDFILSGEMTIPVSEGPRLVELRHVVLLPDGRVGAVVETVTVFGQETHRELAWIWYVQEDGRFLIDGIATIEQSGEATPGPD